MDKESRFKGAIELNKDRIYRLCCCYVADNEARKDVYQEVLINIWSSFDSFESRSQISTWIYRVTINTCLGYLRSERRRKKIFQGGSDVDAETVADPDEGREQGQIEADVQRLYECVTELGPVDRALISLYLEDVSTREMAEILGISEVNVRVKLHRVKKSLKELLERRGHGTE